MISVGIQRRRGREGDFRVSSFVTRWGFFFRGMVLRVAVHVENELLPFQKDCFCQLADDGGYL
jgi:hypothetical protein